MKSLTYTTAFFAVLNIKRKPRAYYYTAYMDLCEI